MNKYYFEDDSSKFEEFSIEPFGWFLSMESDEADESAFEGRDTFESDYYLEHCITDAIGKPPLGSMFKLNRIETDYDESGSRVYERLIFIYCSKKERHRNYRKELAKLLNSKQWNKRCQQTFEVEYQKFLEFKKKYPEEDYEF